MNAAMISQSKRHSVWEQITNQITGFAISWPVNCFLLPSLGMKGGAGAAAGVTVLFMAISFVRGYFTRRFFNWWHVRRIKKHYTLPSQTGTQPAAPPREHPPLVAPEDLLVCYSNSSGDTKAVFTELAAYVNKRFQQRIVVSDLN